MAEKKGNEPQEQYVPTSNSSIYAPFGGWIGFMQSYGLKHWDVDDIEEGNRIVEGMKAIDKYNWEQDQAAKATKK